eukprot:UC1_evm1s1057
MLNELTSLSAQVDCKDWKPVIVRARQPAITSGDGNLDLRVEGEKDIRFSRRSVESVSVFSVLQSCTELRGQFSELETRANTMQESMTQAFTAVSLQVAEGASADRAALDAKLQGVTVDVAALKTDVVNLKASLNRAQSTADNALSKANSAVSSVTSIVQNSLAKTTADIAAQTQAVASLKSQLTTLTTTVAKTN